MKVIEYRVVRVSEGPWYAPAKVWGIERVFEDGRCVFHPTYFYGHYRAMKLAKYLAHRFGGKVVG